MFEAIKTLMEKMDVWIITQEQKVAKGQVKKIYFNRDEANIMILKSSGNGYYCDRKFHQIFYSEKDCRDHLVTLENKRHTERMEELQPQD